MTTLCQNPCEGYCPSQEQLCFWEEFIVPKLEDMIPNKTLIDAVLEGINIYDCDDDKLYQCDDVVLYPRDGKFYKSLKDDNDRDPQDSGAWEEYDSLKGMMSKVDILNEKALVGIDYHASCAGGCIAMASEGQCVAIKYDTGETDSCDNPIFEDHFYISLEDKNIDVPAPDAESWEGPVLPCDLFKSATTTVCEELQELPVSTDMAGG